MSIWQFTILVPGALVVLTCAIVGAIGTGISLFGDEDGRRFYSLLLGMTFLAAASVSAAVLKALIGWAS